MPVGGPEPTSDDAPGAAAPPRPGSAGTAPAPTLPPESDRPTPPDHTWSALDGAGPDGAGAEGPTPLGADRAVAAHLVGGVFQLGALRVEGVYDTPTLCPGRFAVLPVEDVGAATGPSAAGPSPPGTAATPLSAPTAPAPTKAPAALHGAGLVYADLATGALRPLLAAGGRPDRPWLDPSCATLVFAWAPRGLVGLWRLDLDRPGEGAPTPLPLTNVGLVATPGRAPEGFLPPPRRGGLWLDGDTLRWQGEDGLVHHLATPFVAGSGR